MWLQKLFKLRKVYNFPTLALILVCPDGSLAEIRDQGPQPIAEPVSQDEPPKYSVMLTVTFRDSTDT